jgi:peptide-methionine (S)-S-oxide reductase
MRALAGVVLSLAWATNGRRTQIKGLYGAANTEQFQSLATLLLSSASAARASARVRSPAIHSARALQRRAADVKSQLDFFGFGDPQMVKPSDALKGSDKPITAPGRHYVLGNQLEEVPEGFKVAVFANGCFWGSEKGIWRLPGGGIYTTAVGYCAGFTPNPTYEEACSGRTGHTEGVRVVYDPAKISFVDILRFFWEAHDPTSGMGQGNDRGTQYRSGFYYFDEEQKALIEASKAAYENALKAAGKGRGPTITTEIAAAADYDQYGGLWYYAEGYHQQYLAKPGARPYCSAQPQQVSLPPFEQWAPAGLEHHAPKLPETFWKEHAPGRPGCKVVNAPNGVIEFALEAA